MSVLKCAAASEPGLVRRDNQDAVYAGQYLLAVADGMGGHAGGEIASQIAIRALAVLDRAIEYDPVQALDRAVGEAARRLRERIEHDQELTGMGTTLTAMLRDGPRIAFAHIGDSRAYLLREGALYQLTHDHTLVQALLDGGRITPEQAATHPRRAMLSRALDGSHEVDCDLWLTRAEFGDRYLLCTDGLSGVVAAEHILEVLADVETPDKAVRHLVDLAYQGGAPDNVTCVVADVTDGSSTSPAGNHAAETGAVRPSRRKPAYGV